MKKNMIVRGCWVLGALVIASCGGGSGSSTVASGSDALQVAEQVSVVDPKATTEASLSRAIKALKANFGKAASSLAADSDYATDVTHTYVSDRAGDAFSIVNEILCSLDQTRYVEMLGQGNYKALVDIGQCSQDKDSASGAGQSSQDQSTGATATSYETWIVNSSREEDQPHIVNVWIEQEPGFDFPEAATIFVHGEITEGVSASNSIGLFTVDFLGCANSDAACASPIMQGYLRSEDVEGDILLKFFVTGGGGAMEFTESATLNRSSEDAGGGSAIAYDREGGESKTFNMAYNGDYFYRGDADGSDATCLDRNNFITNVWRYGLYQDENHATPGARVDIANPSFQIKFTSGDETFYGDAGYYGVWLPQEAGLASGDTVYKQEYSDNATVETPYTVFIAGGRLQRHQRQSITLGDVVGIPLSWNTCQQTGDSWSCNEYRVQWDGTQFTADATRSESTGWMWQDMDAPETVSFSDTDYSFNFWSESLGGDGRINLFNKETGDRLSASDLTDDTEVIFNKIDTVYPGDADVPATLACLENCFDPSVIDTESPYFTLSTYEGGDNNFNMINQQIPPDELVSGDNYIAYAFDPEAMVLTYGGDPVVSTAEEGFGAWGGSLFDPTDAANLTALECNMGSPEGPVTGTCSWQVWDLNTFYTWETGPNEWNKMTSLQDSDGNYVAFDPPLMVEYTRSTTGAKYYLQYNGFGNLWGIPGKCIDADSGEEVECYKGDDDERNIRWVPEFSVVAGDAVIDTASELTYYVKPIDQEQQMIAAEVSACTGAGLSLTSYTLPDATLVADPGIGAKPNITDAPAVVGGVVQ